MSEDFNFTANNETDFQDAHIDNRTLPPDLAAEPNISVIVVYSALFIIAAIGNLTVFISLFKSRHRKSRISLMIRNLTIADLIVTFVMIPLEIGWRLTGRWIAGNVACKVFLFLRAFGPYLSSNVLVCISLDRYFAVLHPLKVNDARRRGKVMLAFAWGTSFIYCIPQSFVFRVMAHPKYPYYTQCVSFGFFTSPFQEVTYNLLCVMFMYFIPLLVIISAYTAIMCEISKNSKPTNGETYRSSSGRLRLRRSDISNIAIERARSRTLKMTIMIVAVYVWCCTPYVIITLWYMFDRDSAQSLPEWLQDTFFMMVVSNSCMNPIVYGSYAINCRQNCRCLTCFKNRARTANFNLKNGDLPLATAQNGVLAMDVFRSFLRFNKESGANRNTDMTNVLSRNQTIKSSMLQDKICKNKEKCSFERPSVGKVSFSESSSSYHKNSFHSEPLPNTYSLLEHQTLGLITGYTSSEPIMSSKCDMTVSMNVTKTEVYYHHGSNERTRNI